MKSQLFKTAWTIAKTSKVSFSEALTTAWKAFKNGVVVGVNAAVKNNPVLSFSKKVENKSFFCSTIDAVLFNVKNYVKVNLEGVRHDYGIGAYNGD